MAVQVPNPGGYWVVSGSGVACVRAVLSFRERQLQISLWTTRLRPLVRCMLTCMNMADSESGAILTNDDGRSLNLFGRDRGTRADRRLARGIYAADDGRAVGFETRARGVLQALGGKAVLSHYSAAHWWGGTVPHHSHLHITTAAKHRVRRVGVISHRTQRPMRRTVVRGVSVTTAEQTFLDLAGSLDLVELIVLGDSMLKQQATSISQLRAAAIEWRGAGAAIARLAAGLVRTGVGSPMESRLRILIVAAGLPEPAVDHCVYTEHGTLLYRLDLAYPGCKLGIEYDGRQHAENDVQWARDLERREYFDGAGWRLVVVNGRQLFADPGDVLDRIVAAARAQGFAMRKPNTRWRRYFSAANR